MERIVYTDGRYVPASDARISVFDRGFLFGDAVYEVTAVLAGRMIDNDLHLARLERSLGELGIAMPLPRKGIEAVQRDLIAKNGLNDGTVYLQVSRGSAERNFLYPAQIVPTLIGFTQPKQLLGTQSQASGIAVALVPDPRWNRRDIKTSMLLGQVLAKREAHAAGFDDVWFYEDDRITEAGSASVFIVTSGAEILTRPNSHSVLPGCTRMALLRLCDKEGLRLREATFSPRDAQDAAEAFQTSASTFVTPVVRIADKVIGTGKPGPMTRKLQEFYLDAVQAHDIATH